MNQENGKGIIFGVLGILTLIIAIMGASLAYFTATAMDTDPEEIIVQAATVTIAFENGTSLEAKDLIPASFEVIDWAYKRGLVENELGVQEDKQCIDDKGYKVCSVYRFSISNEAGKNDTAISGKITTTTDKTLNKDEREFENLMYTIYEVQTADNWQTVTDRTEINTNHHTTFAKNAVGANTTEVFNHDVEDELSANEYKVGAGEKKYFELVIWLNEKTEGNLADDTGEGNQDFEQGLTYSGTINVSVSGASDKITGTIGE